MRRNLSCFIVQLAIVLFSNPWQALAQGSRMATVAMRPSHDKRAVVAVKVNGEGPYDFVVDTGATITVVDADLVDQLKLPIEGAVTVRSSAATSAGSRSIAREIMVGDLTITNVTIVSMKNPLLGSKTTGIRGILGENFLHHFDLLIDNLHRQVTLDTGNELAASLHGEHLVIHSTPTLTEQGEYLRPRLSVRIQDVGDTNVLLDSGANELIVFHWGNPFGSESTGTNLQTINGKLRCSTRLSMVRFSPHNFKDVEFAACVSATMQPGSQQGILPTAIFRQVFISHAASYVILDPTGSPLGLGSGATVTASLR